MSVLRRETAVGDADNVHFIGSNPDSYGYTDLPSTSIPSTEEDPALYAQGVRVPAAPLPYANNSSRLNRPGWKDTALQRRVDNRPRDKPASVICYQCYLPGHVSTQCVFPPSHRPKIIAYYDALTPEEKESVPRKEYDKARAELGLPVPVYAQPSVPAQAPSNQVQGEVPTHGVQLGPPNGVHAPNSVSPVQKN
ncbi:hypothetical protein FGB62_67g15 [Gracilaria domingensis]|nr:hypothetical protein FGB62_67g15 [Gracilaria domingensis]